MHVLDYYKLWFNKSLHKADFKRSVSVRRGQSLSFHQSGSHKNWWETMWSVNLQRYYLPRYYMGLVSRFVKILYLSWDNWCTCHLIFTLCHLYMCCDPKLFSRCTPYASCWCKFSVEFLYCKPIKRWITLGYSVHFLCLPQTEGSLPHRPYFE